MSAEEHNANHYENEILGILRSRKSPKVIRDELSDYHANDIAEVLPELSARERQMLYRLLSDDDLAGVFEHTDDAVTYLSELDPKKAAQTLEKQWKHARRVWISLEADLRKASTS